VLEKIATALDVDISELFTPKQTGDFVAMLNYKGELRQFNSIKELKAFLNTV
jgi:hypothetical protein